MVLLLQAAITVAYLVVFGRACAVARRRRSVGALMRIAPYVLPAADRPPAGAVGWPPEAPAALAAYVESGLAAVDAYLAERFAS